MRGPETLPLGFLQSHTGGSTQGWSSGHATTSFNRMGVFRPLTRQKNLTDVVNQHSELGKVLSTFDLVALGVGCTLGVGVYVLPGVVAKEIAGPGVVLSFLFAAITSVLAGLCFAEFGARVPKAGSAYIYSYVTVGEFIAFNIGWILIMEYVIGTASVARGLSVYIDKMTGNHMEAYYRDIFEIQGSTFISEYFDIFAFGISIVVTLGLAFGLKESVIVNNLLTFVNVTVVIFVILVGSVKADPYNWQIPETQVPPGYGEGGFLPYGILGAIKGAATCFYGYVGFDVISTSGEEVKNPQKSIPIGIITSLFIIFLAYFGLSAVITLMWPYYLQDPNAPIPFVFSEVGWPWAAWIVAVGGIFGLLASLFSGMFPLPRVLYAMANDGLLFKFLGKVHPKYKTPFVGTLLAGFITAVMAATFQLKQLVDFMSIGTLLAYTIVAGCVLLLRYRHESGTVPVTHESVEHTHLVSNKVKVTCSSMLRQYFNRRYVDKPTPLTSAIVVLNTIMFSVVCVLLGLVTVQWEAHLVAGDAVPLFICGVLVALMVAILWSIALQPSQTQGLKFKVPLVPFLPGLSIFINIYLMMSMDMDTWIRFIVWLGIGFLIYFSYGIFHSAERSINQPVEYKVIRTDDETE